LNTENNIDICATTDPHCSAVFSAIAELLVFLNQTTLQKEEFCKTAAANTLTEQLCNISVL